MKHKHLIILFILLPVSLCAQLYYLVLDGQKAPNYQVWLYGKEIAQSADGGVIKLDEVSNLADMLFISPTGVQYEGKQDEFVPEYILLSPVAMERVIIQAIGQKNAPVAQSNLNAKDIEELNLGRDIPMLLDMLPGTVVSSDAGAGVGYTDIRIRGTDGTRTNVTVNGVPINDAESQGTYWVNMPDLASSAQNIQVQRGAGTSTNGPGAFGASINVQTGSINDAYGYFQSSAGSFNTFKNTVAGGTGWINNKWNLEMRLSQISSDGFIDRSQADLQSYMLSVGYKHNDKTSIKYLSFGGKERTNQAWNGVPIEKYNNDGLVTHYLRNAGSTYKTREDSVNLFTSENDRYNFYTYNNEIDDYSQLHNHLYINHQFNKKNALNITLYSTVGKGFFEQYKGNAKISDYGYAPTVVGNDTITRSDVVRQRWLDNSLMGINANYTYSHFPLNVIVGGGYNNYVGDHFGKIKWARIMTNASQDATYYYSDGIKVDGNIYAKANYVFGSGLTGFADLQLRRVYHEGNGTDNDLRRINFTMDAVFFNPKAGITWQPHKNIKSYYSVSVAHKEPSRGDFTDNRTNTQPKAEQMIDHELGLEYSVGKFRYLGNFYYMDYKNQLIMTGAINDVGNAIRTNVASSYRAGVENALKYFFKPNLALGGNISISQNRIKEFDNIFIDYNDYSEVRETLKDKAIALSPNMVAALQLVYQPIKSVNLSYNHKFVSKQYLDNTENDRRSLPSFNVGSFMASWAISSKHYRRTFLQLHINNLWDVKYASRGYTYGYYYTPESFTDEVFVFPQAGRNIQVGVKLDF
jgi:iron complex outermembrane recepter protein